MQIQKNKKLAYKSTSFVVCPLLIRCSIAKVSFGFATISSFVLLPHKSRGRKISKVLA